MDCVHPAVKRACSGLSVRSSSVIRQHRARSQTALASSGKSRFACECRPHPGSRSGYSSSWGCAAGNPVAGQHATSGRARPREQARSAAGFGVGTYSAEFRSRRHPAGPDFGRGRKAAGADPPPFGVVCNSEEAGGERADSQDAEEGKRGHRGVSARRGWPPQGMDLVESPKPPVEQIRGTVRSVAGNSPRPRCVSTLVSGVPNGALPTCAVPGAVLAAPVAVLREWLRSKGWPDV